MSGEPSGEGDSSGTPPQQQTEQVPRTGAGAGTALDAMLKKRKMRPEPPPVDGADDDSED